ncbi:hypothetical protein K5M36_16520 [Chromobacterium vaccinii]|nr:hypothetical protein [Chromobacterium vaccinii]
MNNKITAIAIAISLLSPTYTYARGGGFGGGIRSSAPVSVKGYFRKDGTYVQPHMRSAPDGISGNNWSTVGNTNPYTGKPGTHPDQEMVGTLPAGSASASSSVATPSPPVATPPPALANTDKQIFSCSSPVGGRMDQDSGHKLQPDSYSKVMPMLAFTGDSMFVQWGDSASTGGKAKLWEPVVFSRNNGFISGVTMDQGEAGIAVMLYSFDTSTQTLYMSSHKKSPLLHGVVTNMFVSKCQRI